MAETLEELERRLSTLETEHEALSARFSMLTNFTMNMVHLLAEDEDREALRSAINKLIIISRGARDYDTLNDAQDLLRSFETVMPSSG